MTLHRICLSAALALGLAASLPAQSSAAAGRVTVGNQAPADFVGRDERPFLDALRRLGPAGGTIVVQPGEYLFRRQIDLPSQVTVEGSAPAVISQTEPAAVESSLSAARRRLVAAPGPRALIRLPRPARLAAAVEAGQDALEVDDPTPFAANTTIQVCPPATGREIPGDTRDCVRATIGSIDGRRLQLTKPLDKAFAAGSRVGYEGNAFAVGKSNRNIRLARLAIDGGRVADLPMPGHAQRCGLLAHGVFSYERGPSAPRIEGVEVVGCHIFNCYGRAVAFYSVERGAVRDCLTEDIADESIDIDHFTVHTEVTGNDIRRGVTGVTINDGSYCRVADNRIEQCDTGLTIWWWKMCPQTDIDIENVLVNNYVDCRGKVALSIGDRTARNRAEGNVLLGKVRVAGTDNVQRDNLLRP